MFRTKANEYCLALEKFPRANEILLGGTFLRQNNYIFDIENSRIGVARASCNTDPNQIADQADMKIREIEIPGQGSIPAQATSIGQRYVKDLD